MIGGECWDEESAYDEKIAPLMKQIIAICKEHRIPLIASFQYQTTDEHGDAYCTTTLPFDGRTGEKLTRAMSVMRVERPIVLAETITTDPETGAKQISIRRMQ
jgi:hypothetical protein